MRTKIQIEKDIEHQLKKLLLLFEERTRVVQSEKSFRPFDPSSEKKKVSNIKFFSEIIQNDPNPKVWYKGNEYYLRFIGHTKYGKRAKLEFTNSPFNSFWVDADLINSRSSKKPAVSDPGFEPDDFDHFVQKEIEDLDSAPDLSEFYDEDP